MELIFAPNGTTVINLVARDSVQLDMPGDERGVARRIKSATLEASGPPDTGIQSARFLLMFPQLGRGGLGIRSAIYSASSAMNGRCRYFSA